MAIKPLRKHFRLVKIKLKKDDSGPEIDWIMKESRGAHSMDVPYNSPLPWVCHPDLVKLIHSLDKALMRTHNMDTFERIFSHTNDMSNDEVKAVKTLEKLIKKTSAEMLRRISVTGIAISGEDKNYGVIITGTNATDSAIDVAINSPRIIFERDKFGIEPEIKDIVAKIEEEVFEYIYEAKQAQQQIIFEEPTATEEKTKKKKQLEIVEEKEQA